MKDGSLFTKDEYDPIHVRDLAILTNRCTKECEEQLQFNSANQCDVKKSSSTASDSEGRVESVPRVHVRTFAM